MQQYPESDPRHHTANIKAMLKETGDHAREDVTKIDDPRAKALFETTREVLYGLVKAYDDYEKGTEPAWQR